MGKRYRIEFRRKRRKAIRPKTYHAEYKVSHFAQHNKEHSGGKVMSNIAVANAPVSYGVFNLSEGVSGLPDGNTLLEWVSSAGYQGIDLGAPGLLGSGSGLVENLKAHNLALAGGWIELPLASDSDDIFGQAFSELPVLLEDFALVAQAFPGVPPKPTLADQGDEIRKAHPGGGLEYELDDDRWRSFACRLSQVVDLVRSFGLEPTFHHHACTYVETPREIERLLALSDIGLTFDSGHLLVGGGDPLTDYQRWYQRINHLHLKDVDLALLKRVIREPDPMFNLWSQRAFVPLGQGDLDINGLMDAIVASDFSGWLVVEQDVVPSGPEEINLARLDQVHNRQKIERWLP